MSTSFTQSMPNVYQKLKKGRSRAGGVLLSIQVLRFMSKAYWMGFLIPDQQCQPQRVTDTYIRRWSSTHRVSKLYPGQPSMIPQRSFLFNTVLLPQPLWSSKQVSHCWQVSGQLAHQHAIGTWDSETWAQ